MSHESAIDINLPDDTQLVSCEVCIKTVPLSESHISEAQDYITFFCGLDCYEQWLNGHQDDLAD